MRWRCVGRGECGRQAGDLIWLIQAVLALEKSHSVRLIDKVGAINGSGSPEDLLDVLRDSVLAHMQFIADLRIGQPARDQLKNRALPGRESRKSFCGFGCHRGQEPSVGHYAQSQISLCSSDSIQKVAILKYPASTLLGTMMGGNSVIL